MARESEYTTQGIGLSQDWRGGPVGTQAVAPRDVAPPGASESEDAGRQRVLHPYWRGGEEPVATVAPPGASLAGDAVSLANGLSRLHEALTTLNDRLHGPRPRPAPDAGKTSPLGEPALRLTLDRALALVSACEGELAEAMGRL